jgi:hypothetical protein
MATHAHTARVKSERDVLAEFFRCPEGFVDLPPPQGGLASPGFFRFGKHTIGYGATTTVCPPAPSGQLPDLMENFKSNQALPFDPGQILDNLLLERYAETTHSVLASGWMRRIYYGIRPFISDSIRNILQRHYFQGWKQLPFPTWPVDTSVENLRSELLGIAMRRNGVDRVPFLWFWPEGASAAAIMTHDVEAIDGLAFVPSLLGIDREFGIPASYQIVPEQRYRWKQDLLELIRAHGCEVNVHDLTHGGNLFADREDFRKQAKKINHYASVFEAKGFRAACMYRNQAWFSELNVSYDMSVPNVAHLEPQRGGCCTVFPYFVGEVLELPLTMIQDFSLFHMLRSYSPDLWEQQIAIVKEQHGLMSFIAHPDYLLEEHALAAYKALLGRIAELRRTEGVWVALPREVAQWWRDRNATNVVQRGSSFALEGPARERGRIAYAHLDGDRIRYELP